MNFYFFVLVKEFLFCFEDLPRLLLLQMSMNVLSDLMTVVQKIPNVVTIQDHSVVNVNKGTLRMRMEIVLVRKPN